MIVKQGRKWLVKDSSGKKILGTHSTKQSAIKQLGAIEASKAKTKKEMSSPQKINVDEFYMIKLCNLIEKKESLKNRLEEMKTKNLLALLSEQPYAGGANAPGQYGQNQSPPQQLQQRNLKGRRRPISNEQPNAEDNTQQKEDPFPMAQGHMGIALTPQTANAQTELLTKYFDDPNTQQREVANEPTWQNVQTSIAHSVGQEVNKKLRQFGLLG